MDGPQSLLAPATPPWKEKNPTAVSMVGDPNRVGQMVGPTRGWAHTPRTGEIHARATCRISAAVLLTAISSATAIKWAGGVSLVGFDSTAFTPSG
ncbi:Phytocyanin domain-containing protein [Psidium guajava]|nr:Phytocyanin domain-containing protein [Psidium guajava]